MNNIILTINRECGSGGGEIARRLGEKLGLKVYNRAMFDTLAKQFDISLENIERIKAKKNNWWNEFCRFYQQLGAASYNIGSRSDVTPMSLYYAEARILKDLAEQESCIIVGRAGFHIFRDYPNALHMLIIADREARIARIAAKQHLSADEAANVIDSVDKARDTFVKSVADTSRYDARHYDFVFNVTGMNPDTVVSFLADNIRHKIEADSRNSK